MLEFADESNAMIIGANSSSVKPLISLESGANGEPERLLRLL
jgi:hypothetical protein